MKASLKRGGGDKVKVEVYKGNLLMGFVPPSNPFMLACFARVKSSNRVIIELCA